MTIQLVHPADTSLAAAVDGSAASTPVSSTAGSFVADTRGDMAAAMALSRPSAAEVKASSRWLWLCAPALLAGFAVLALAGVAHLLFLVQGLALLLALLLMVTGSRAQPPARAGSLQALAALLVLLLAAPLLHAAVSAAPAAAVLPASLSTADTLSMPESQPARWLALGSFQLYSGALVLPALLVLLGALLQQPGRTVPVVVLALSAGCFLWLQTDTAQLLALTVALVLLLLPGLKAIQASPLLWLCALALVAFSYLALQQPQALPAVPYVEGVFALAWQHDWRAGMALLLAAGLLVLGLYGQSQQDQPWLAAVAGYYAVCFGGSAAGVTPAPLLGYGAAPLLGYGLMLGLSLWARWR